MDNDSLTNLIRGACFNNAYQANLVNDFLERSQEYYYAVEDDGMVFCLEDEPVVRAYWFIKDFSTVPSLLSKIEGQYLFARKPVNAPSPPPKESL